MHRITRASIAFALTIAAVSRAHPGPRIWIGVVDGKIVTYAGPYPPSDPSNYEPDIGFAQALADEGDDLWDTDFPGFQKVPGGDIPVGTTLSYNIMGPVLWLNSTDPTRCPFFETVYEAFALDPSIPQFAITNEQLQIQYTSTGFVSGDAAFAYNGNDGDHDHLTYTLLGDGVNPGDGSDGIYALQLQLTAPGITPSDTIYLLLGKNVTDEDLESAEDALLNPRIPPDLDCDGDVDLSDFVDLAGCLVGPDATPKDPDSPPCSRADFSDAPGIDLSEFWIFQRCFAVNAEYPSDCDYIRNP